VVHATPSLVVSAVDTSERYRIGFWDALIVEAAALAKCEVLLSEDLSHGEKIRGVVVQNPFR
jgi:predicted nucleic acid-binding protein